MHSFSSQPLTRNRTPDLRRLGQTTKIARSTLDQVRARIAMLREKTKEASKAKSYDFAQRLADIRAKEEELRQQRKQEKLKAKEAMRAELVLDASAQQEQDEMAKLMGFGNFGTSKK